MTDMYILIDGEPVQCPSILDWALWFEQSFDRRIVELTEADGVVVSTVFLGIDHGFFVNGPPVLWETMIFGGPHDGYQRRYTSRVAAQKGHADSVALAVPS